MHFEYMLTYFTSTSPFNSHPYFTPSVRLTLCATFPPRAVRSINHCCITFVVGATDNRIEDLRKADPSTECGLLEVEKVGDECLLPFEVRILTVFPQMPYLLPYRLCACKILLHASPWMSR